MTSSAQLPSPVLSPLQTQAWAHYQRRLGKPVSVLSGPGWRALCVLERRRVGSFLYCPYGPTCNDKDALADALAALARLGRRQRCLWVRAEPMPASHVFADDAARDAFRDQLTRSGWSRAARDRQPSLSRFVDVSGDEAAILAGMTGSNRTIYRTHATRGLEVRTSQDPADVDVLAGFLAEEAAARGIKLPQADDLRAQAETLMPLDAATLYTTWHDGAPVCATLVYDSPQVRLFAHSAMPAQHRRLRANQPLLATAILDAHGRGQRWCDLFGVAPADDPGHRWAGFSAFKRSFGGVDVEHLGTWERALLPGVLALRDAVGRRRAAGANGETAAD